MKVTFTGKFEVVEKKIDENFQSIFRVGIRAYSRLGAML